MAAFGGLVFKISKQPVDNWKLGIWGHITITGKNEIKTSIFTYYCPCWFKSPDSVYSQQLTYMVEKTPTRHKLPSPTIWNRPKNWDRKKIEKGHQILLMGDFNSEYTDLTLWMLELVLIDIIAKIHGLGPRTRKFSRDAPIDCVFGLKSFQKSKGGSYRL